MKNLLASLVLLSFISNVNAEFIDNGNYTSDTRSGLDWLDLTETINMSYNYVSSQFGKGGAFEGWQYATGLQFDSMVANFTGTATVNSLGSNYFGEGADSIDSLVQLLGNTYYPNSTSDLNDINYSYGMIADTPSSGRRSGAIINDYHESSSLADNAWAHETTFNLYNGNRYNGSFLVRGVENVKESPHLLHQIVGVNESPAILLLVVGLLGLLGTARRKV